MTTHARREAHIATLREGYRAELDFLNSHGTSADITFAGGNCTAIQAVVVGRRLLATNGDHCLIGPDEDNDDQDLPVQWHVGLYDIDDRHGDVQVADGTGPDLPSAYLAAMESLVRGDFDGDA